VLEKCSQAQETVDQPRLGRERLHRRSVEFPGIGEDGELIALERRIREDVLDDAP
jgi:hypothetical protein